MKKNGLIALGAVALLGLASSASADVTGLTARFGGGCIAANSGSCTIKVTATGDDLGSQTVVLQHSADGRSGWRNVSSHERALDDTGRTSFKFRNVKACYRVITGRNGNDAPDVRSRAVCE